MTREFLESFIAKTEFDLIATQERLSIPIIKRIHKKMLAGILFGSITVDGNAICNGHHRYLASLLAAYDLDRVPSFSNREQVQWTSIILEDADWDTEDRVNQLNMDDANYNNLTIGQVLDILEN